MSTRTIKAQLAYPKLSQTTFKPGRLAGSYRFSHIADGKVVMKLDKTFSPDTLEFPLEMVPVSWVNQERKTITYGPDYVCYISYNYPETEYFFSTES